MPKCGFCATPSLMGKMQLPEAQRYNVCFYSSQCHSVCWYVFTFMTHCSIGWTLIHHHRGCSNTCQPLPHLFSIRGKPDVYGATAGLLTSSRPVLLQPVDSVEHNVILYNNVLTIIVIDFSIYNILNDLFFILFTFIFMMCNDWSYFCYLIPGFLLFCRDFHDCMCFQN